MKLPFGAPIIEKEERDAVAKVLDGPILVHGPKAAEFEDSFKKFTKAPYAISVSSCTAGMHLIYFSLGLGPGDEVITTAHSWISTSETITQTGAKVVFCDTNLDDYLIDVSEIEKLITPKTKGIIPVHLFGQSADMDPLLRISNDNNLWVIEDCAQAHFAKYKGKTVGTFGDAATFSFYPGKNLGAMGDAGCIITNRSDIAEYAKLFARHGGKGEHIIEGINSRMDGIQAAVLNVKLNYINEWTRLRQNAANYYTGLFSDFEKIKLPKINIHNNHVFHLYVIKSKDRDNLKLYLNKQGIQTVINYPNSLPFCKAYDYLGKSFEDFPNAYKNQAEILSLPIYPEISCEEQNYIVKKIKLFFK